MISTHAFQSFTFSTTFNPKPRPTSLNIESHDSDLSILERLPEMGFAVIGSRTPQRRSYELLEETLKDLKGSDLIIISGLARGIDSRAHELALEHGLKTVAVLGCGIDIDYPRENRVLRRRIVENGGLIISQFQSNAEPYKSNFLDRNQLIAGLSKAIWVVEAAAISGTLNTAKHAADFNRELFATPCFPGDPFFQGNEKLLSERQPHRYPRANPLFSSHDLEPIWPSLFTRSTQPTLFSSASLSEIQRWVLQIKSEYGECRVQMLMNHAYTCGLTLGKFYLQYEKEIENGSIRQDEAGCVDIA